MDNILKAAAESLSRQIACLQIKEPTGFSGVHEQKLDISPANETVQVNEINELDVLDDIEDGKVISTPGKEDNTVNFGVDEDLSDLI